MDPGGHDQLSSIFQYVGTSRGPPPMSFTDLLRGSTTMGELATDLGLSATTGRSSGSIPVTSTMSSSSPEAAAIGESGNGLRLRLKQQEEVKEHTVFRGAQVGEKTNAANRNKKVQIKSQKEPRFAFATKSEVDHLEDGYRWRKYGQKAVKNSPYPRSYYRCTAQKCAVKKRVERCFQDPSVVVTTYEGKHTHQCPTTIRGSTTQLLAPPPPPPQGTLPMNFYHDLMIQQLLANCEEANLNPYMHDLPNLQPSQMLHSLSMTSFNYESVLSFLDP